MYDHAKIKPLTRHYFHNHLDNASKFESFHLEMRIFKYLVKDIKFLIFHLENSICRIKIVKSMSFTFSNFINIKRVLSGFCKAKYYFV